jgi:hypothetical protein
LIGLREFQPDKADVIHKYSTEEVTDLFVQLLPGSLLDGTASATQARNLQAFGELPTNARINQTAVDMALDGAEGAEEDTGIDFDDVSASSLFACLVKGLLRAAPCDALLLFPAWICTVEITFMFTWPYRSKQPRTSACMVQGSVLVVRWWL